MVNFFYVILVILSYHFYVWKNVIKTFITFILKFYYKLITIYAKL